MRSPGLKSRVMFEGRRRESQDQKGEQRSRDREMRARTRAGTGGPAGGGGCLGVSRRACRAATLGLRGALAASAHVHAGHLRHQLPQRRLNGSELQPPPPLPPPSLRRSRAAPARRPLALGRTNCSPRWGWRSDRRGSWLGS